NTEIFASLPLALSVLAFLQGERKAGWGWMFLSGALVGVATLIRQPSAVTLGAMLAYLVYVWLIPRSRSLGRFVAVGRGVVCGWFSVICRSLLDGDFRDIIIWQYFRRFRFSRARHSRALSRNSDVLLSRAGDGSEQALLVRRPCRR